VEIAKIQGVMPEKDSLQQAKRIKLKKMDRTKNGDKGEILETDGRS